MGVAYDVAAGYFGLKEYPGAKHNPEIIRMAHASGGKWVNDDETPWCAAFVGACLGEAGLNGTSSLRARSYEKWGVEVKPKDVQRGDVVVKSRGHPSSGMGHVFFFHAWGTDGKTVLGLGGNQGDQVRIDAYPLDEIVAFRRSRGKRKSMAHSRTMQGSVASLAAQGGTMYGVAQVFTTLDPVVQYMLIGTLGIGVLMTLYVCRRRVLDWIGGHD